MPSQTRVLEIQVSKHEFPLIKPYILSFDTISVFEAYQVQIAFSSGKVTIGEVVPLFGYSTETSESIGSFLNTLPDLLENKTVEDARAALVPEINDRPFSVSAPLTAIDLHEIELDTDIDLNKFEYVVPSSVDKIEELVSLYEKTCLENNGTLKIKLSGKASNDIAALQRLAPSLEGDKKDLRLDANQAYDWENGERFFTFLNDYSGRGHIQYIEQPFPVDRWGYNLQLKQGGVKTPIMLDEAVITLSDIDKTIESGVNIIKLKLYKQGGIKELIECATYANDRGLKVVLGNGVAGELTNRIEAAVYKKYPHLFERVLEGNGFKKLLQ